MDFFIVGTSRCGSTLLRSLLAKVPGVGVLNESHWLATMFEFVGTQAVSPDVLLSIAEKTTWDSGLDLFEVNAQYSQNRDLCDSDTLKQQFRDLVGRHENLTVAEFHDLFVRTVFPESAILGDKTPDYGFFMKQLQTLWPSAKFVHIVREGLPTARSMSRHRGCRLMVSAGYDNWCTLSYDRLYAKYQVTECALDDFVGTWRRRLSRIRNESRRLEPGSYLEVSYESLLTTPDDVLTELVTFLGLSVTDGWLADCRASIKPGKAANLPSLVELGGLSPENLRALHPLGLQERDISKQFKSPLNEASRRLDSGEPESAALLALSWISSHGHASHDPHFALARHIIASGLTHRGHTQLAEQWR